MDSDVIAYTYTESPLGPLLIARSEAGLTRISFQTGTRAVTPEPNWRRDDEFFHDAVEQLAAYFAGTLRGFDLALAPGGTAFQQAAWKALIQIPYGETETYGHQARRMGRPTAARAVGAANGRNPLPIVIPCHRVIGSTGKLTGYAGGLRFKKALLAHERKHITIGQSELSFD